MKVTITNMNYSKGHIPGDKPKKEKDPDAPEEESDEEKMEE